MATVRRIGFGTIFELENDVVGIGTDNPTHKLQALGNIRSEAATDIGISSLSTYQGFVDKEARFTTGQIDNQSQSGSTSGEIVIDGDVTVSSATTFTSGPQHLTVTDTFTLPSGDTNSRELKPTAGSLRFNQDFATLEFYTGNNWATVNTFTEMQNSPSNRGRAIVAGGNTPSGGAFGNNIDFVNIHSSGNSQAFGELTLHSSRHTIATSNSIRGLVKHGFTPSAGSDNDIEYITIASEGNGIDFGDSTYSAWGNGFLASSTRGVLGGGVGAVNTIDYVQIMTLGDALDFGDLSIAMRHTIGYSSPTRGIIGTGDDGSNNISRFDAITIASTGNGIDFGNAIVEARAVSACSNTTRGVWMGGYCNSPRGGTIVKAIGTTIISSGGQATEFGQLSTQKSHSRSTCSQTRVIEFGGQNPSGLKLIESLEFASGGNTQFFGELQENTQSCGALSDSHGGLGGF